MYISRKELSIINLIIDRFQVLVDDQTVSQNNLFPEGISNARELANKGEFAIKNITDREVIRRAKKIAKNRSEN